MRVATWNVNSVKQRLPRLLPWLDERQPDVFCLQETKLADGAFERLLGQELARRGYAIALHGEAQWNGVAILSREGLEDVVAGIHDAPGFPRPEARAVAATCGGVRVHCVYVPNGRVPDSEHYRYKLAWLAALRELLRTAPEATIVCGDMNIAPTDADVFDPDAYTGHTHVTPPERAALAKLRPVGHFLRQRMLEGVERLGVELLLVDELARDEIAKRVLELGRLELDDPFQDRRGKLLADHCRRLQYRLIALREAVDARGEGGLHAGRHRRLLDGSHEPVTPAFALEAPRLDQRLHELLDEEGVASGLLADQLRQPVE